MARGARRCTLALALWPLLGCEAALDLQRAQPTWSPEAGVPLPVELTSCEVVDGACPCIMRCGPERTACLRDADCRKAAKRHASCLGADCRDEATRAGPAPCGESELALSEGPAVEALNDCVTKANCNFEACHSALISQCEQYCYCMADDARCKGTPQSPWTGSDDQVRTRCMSDCMNLPPEVRSCRTAHCEFARSKELSMHCRHAVGAKGEDPCANAAPIPECTSKASSAYPCHHTADCCDGLQCTNDVCGVN
jgi:hypothetical protein